MDNLHSKHCAIQSQLNAPKDAFNPFGKYKYRSAESILAAAKPLLQEHSLTLTLNDSVIAVGERIYIKATATLSDGTNTITAEAYAREPESKKGADESQITGAASSYARKYALCGLFGHISNFEYMQRNGRVIEMTRMTECILSCSERF
ncbi:MAG: ERF family protein [Kingella oralis]